jgi:hypothetical protein
MPSTQRVALFDELAKIAEEGDTRQRSGFGKALRTMGVAAAGAAAGYGTAELMSRKLKFFTQPNESRARAARIILPILSGAAVTLADRYRQRMNQEYSRIHGYEKGSR